MTTRAQLQSKSIDELRTIASTAGIETDGLQKSKLITALIDTGQVAEAAPIDAVDLPKATPRTEKSGDEKDSPKSRDGGQRQHDGQRQSQRQGGQRQGGQGQGDQGQGDQGQRRRNRRRRDEEQIPEEDLEVREGLLD
ncbi:MAG: hypothetical protein U9N56_11665, partial [Actinomycetota bacterium]|nr:hypothetical protein [Actinomycetota bacterium]